MPKTEGDISRRTAYYARATARVMKELTRQEQDVFETLDEVEKRQVLDWMLASGLIGDEKNLFYKMVWEQDYARTPVSIEQFIDDEYYLGSMTTELRPCWREDLLKIFAPDSRCTEWICTGSTGTGKCVIEGTLINTAQGFVPIEQVVESKRASVQTRSGVMRRVTNFHDEGETKTIRVRTEHGHVIEGRPNHRVLVLDGMDAKWKCLSDVCPGDVTLRASATRFGTMSVNCETAELMGWAVAEGTVYKNSVTIDLSNDEVDHVYDLAMRLDPVFENASVRVYRERRRIVVTHALFAGIVRSGTASKKVVPRAVLEGTRQVVLSFLRGLFSGDGTVDGGVPTLTTMSEKLAQQVLILMTALGIEASARPSIASYRKKTKRTVTGTKWCVRVVGREAQQKFAKYIDFAQYAKRCQLADYLRNPTTPNTSTGYAFPILPAVARRWRDTQPKRCTGLSKSESPSGIIRRYCYASQPRRVTQRTLRQIELAGGRLPRVFKDIADGRLMFDVVESCTASTGHCYDLSVAGDPSYIANGFVSHNTTAAGIAITYIIYRLSCLRDPLGYYNLMGKTSQLVIGIYSITKKQVSETCYYSILQYVDHSPYFRECFPRNHKIESQLEFINAPIYVAAGSRSLHAIGLNLFAIVLDEANFFNAKQDKSTGQMIGEAFSLYNSATTRMMTRFMQKGGGVPGMSVLISSRNKDSSFTEERLKKANQRYREGMTGFISPNAFVSDRALWEALPKERFGDKTFRVEVGDRLNRSRVLKTKDAPRKGARIKFVPLEFLSKFIEDTDQALRDLAGVSTRGSSPLIHDIDSVYDFANERMRHPFTREEIVISDQDDVLLQSFLRLDDITRIENSSRVPILNPGAKRFGHFDLSLSGDCAGFALGHYGGMIRLRKVRMDGLIEELTKPVVVYDMLLRIRPPGGTGQIELPKLLSFALFLQQIYPLHQMTCDGYQSAFMLQSFRRANIKSGRISTDITTEPYQFFKQGLFERRLSGYAYKPLIDELLDLEIDPASNKVDHPMKSSSGGKGSKDVADAAASVHYAICNEPELGGEVLPMETRDLTQGPPVKKDKLSPDEKERSPSVETKTSVRVRIEPRPRATNRPAGYAMSELQAIIKGKK